ncbi:phosphoribosylanthranilate isomerase [Truepera radiovictrix]|uniref:phosphoribosylanthranilate isomerase n=1 Tax=Truepera radiovictrix TaxID=332249 RepID=UPI0005A510C9|nr:phosphoribosylanthranilate isomerase [Truepera radiovictrix]WMT58258.1 phosphoribosylanthranilate isomerase [Truepera radiovictrix]
MRVKICGVTRTEDALLAEAAGADAVGFIFAERSKRHVTLEAAREMSAALGPFIARVGVFVDAPFEEVVACVRALRLDAVQLHGGEDAPYAAALQRHVRVVRAVGFSPELDPAALSGYPADALLLDGLTPGSGERFSWAAAAAFRGWPRLLLAGGLTPDNVAAGIAALRPYGVDVASGVELRPGVKDPRKVQDFVRAAKSL